MVYDDMSILLQITKVLHCCSTHCIASHFTGNIHVDDYCDIPEVNLLNSVKYQNYTMVMSQFVLL